MQLMKRNNTDFTWFKQWPPVGSFEILGDD
ncbi:hypothetical protein Pmani_028944 [Petrolisthes manimaculis]|uniref:Uncharacterized protein n=1 Tax=Petrolisthes manimaculis TaxID=1843537 RepID=A0AAE1TUD1_9EUCA|nr:hypothetical protein Pmani_028944 [Petrolisthes manimaculis]